jgi:hypothetical protein
VQEFFIRAGIALVAVKSRAGQAADPGAQASPAQAAPAPAAPEPGPAIPVRGEKRPPAKLIFGKP